MNEIADRRDIPDFSSISPVGLSQPILKNEFLMLRPGSVTGYPMPDLQVDGEQLIALHGIQPMKAVFGGGRDLKEKDKATHGSKPMRAQDEVDTLAKSVKQSGKFSDEDQQRFRDAISTALSENRHHFARHIIEKFVKTLNDMGQRKQALTELHRFARSDPEFRKTDHYYDVRKEIDPLPHEIRNSSIHEWWAQRDTEVLTKETERFGMTPELKKEWQDSIATAKKEGLDAYDDMRKAYIDALSKKGDKDEALRDLAQFGHWGGLGIDNEFYHSRRDALDPGRKNATNKKVHDETKEFELLVKETNKQGMTGALKKEWDEAVQQAHWRRKDKEWDSLNRTVIQEHVQRLANTDKPQALAELRRFVDEDFPQGRESDFYKENLAKIFPAKDGESKDMHKARVDFELLKLEGGPYAKWKELATSLEAVKGVDEGAARKLALDVRKNHIERLDKNYTGNHSGNVHKLAELKEVTDKYPQVKQEAWYQQMRDKMLNKPEGADAGRWSKWMEMQALTHMLRRDGPNAKVKGEIEQQLADVKKSDPKLFARATEDYVSALIEKGDTAHAKQQLESHRKEFGEAGWFKDLERHSKGELGQNDQISAEQQAELFRLDQKLAFRDKAESIHAMASADAEAISKGKLDSVIANLKALNLEDDYLAAVNRELRGRGSTIRLQVGGRTGGVRIVSVRDKGEEKSRWFIEQGKPALSILVDKN